MDLPAQPTGLCTFLAEYLRYGLMPHLDLLRIVPLPWDYDNYQSLQYPLEDSIFLTQFDLHRKS